ncbi:FRG domain-containing protein [Rhizobium leguminosarum]|uniref:FRG domain-containing protein n=1 Tax=Rhizobium leguminosarum TaxID=384 RepID=UPI001C9452C5|nr:FRG domain-containing protein [Rhizobium leguminosarum]MBY5396965.1 FRG domain-containing protein [Rhizobium leguminosarum]
MEKIGQRDLWGVADEDDDIRVIQQIDVARGSGKVVDDYNDLIRTLAKIQYHNPDFVLMLRGQTQDHRSNGATIIKPSILRENRGRYPGRGPLNERFQRLIDAERALAEAFNWHAIPDPKQRVLKHRIVRWAILQHYKVVDTPLLDVTLSPRIAASFATSNERSWGFIYVLAVPNISAAVTSSAEAGMQIIRLSSVCPYVAMRPGVQEGYLLGEYPEIDTMETKSRIPYEETDFSLRLISKIKFRPRDFWDQSGFREATDAHLYPDEDEAFGQVIKELRERFDHL